MALDGVNVSSDAVCVERCILPLRTELLETTLSRSTLQKPTDASLHPGVRGSGDIDEVLCGVSDWSSELNAVSLPVVTTDASKYAFEYRSGVRHRRSKRQQPNCGWCVGRMALSSR